ncbi:YheC/YheD family protein [Chengkuizengella sp. SCS-71B]|uniref:YheC/YheD family protein n=1 Tax=Chengkuizengella sp. SCS-71B TaxID=3115290 RepID=UPI0032C234BC
MFTLGKIRKHKWAKYQFMIKNEDLIPYMPETYLMDKEVFGVFLNKYEDVILKPSKGSRGRGVILVSAEGNNRYKIHSEDHIVTKKGREKTYKYLKDKIDNYIIQQSIFRPTINDCPFDFRVITQRKKDSNRWVVTGKVAKVAGEGFIVSNITRSKGHVLPASAAIQMSTISNLPYKSLLRKIDRVALASAHHLVKYYKKNRIFGLDIALDQNGHVWILEANLKPFTSHFKMLEDKSMYRRIKRYKSS